jgi:hypothetical protein
MRSDDEEKAKELQEVGRSVVQLSALCRPMFSTECPLKEQKSGTPVHAPAEYVTVIQPSIAWHPSFSGLQMVVSL